MAKKRVSAEPASKTARSSMPKKGMKEEGFKASADMARIISLAGGEWAYVQDPRCGTLRHLRVGTDSWDFLISELLTDPEYGLRIQHELKTLGWEPVLDG